MPVARLVTIRLLVNLFATHGGEVHHLDVKTAFLHGELKEIVYVTQPEGFEKKEEENKVYRLNKALYGLRLAPRALNNNLNQILCELQEVLQRTIGLSKVSRWRATCGWTVRRRYIFVTGTRVKFIKEFKEKMATNLI